MCGIVGIWKLDSTRLDKRELDKFTDSLIHRGPDGRGIYIDGHSNLGLGHRRLAILDLSNKGKQPMCFANGRYWITFNGEIYNFLEIREELRGLGYTFFSNTDTEVVLAAYDRWGTACQKKFNGMWAFAIWDEAEQELILSRDRFGVKPLFYYSEPGNRYFAFASELKAFLSLRYFPATIDIHTIKRTLRTPMKIAGSEKTWLKEVKRLGGGYNLIIKKGQKPILNRWWNTLEHLVRVPDRYSQQVKKFKELFFQACNIRMRSDVPLGTALSGGLDSSSVLCTMASIKEKNVDSPRQTLDWQKAFIASYPGTPQDETQYARQVVEKVKGKEILIEISPYQALDHLDDIIFQLEEIYNEIPVGPWIVYKTMRQQQIYVSLDGHGGDELLGGYLHHPKWAMRDTVWPLPRPFKLHRLRSTLKHMYPDNGDDCASVIPPMPGIVYLWKRRVYQAKPENFPGLISDQSLLKTHDFDSLNRGLYTDFHYTILPTILRNFDRLSMGHGVEIRAPLLDWRLVCYSFSLPSSSKIGGRYTKRILREAMRGILPESIRLRTTKLGFANPHLQWNKGPFKQFILDQVNSRNFLQTEAWNGSIIKEKAEKAFNSEDWTTIRNTLKHVHAARLITLFRDWRTND